MIRNKIFSINRLVEIVTFLKKRKKRVVFTNGCFDILHVGHISYLNRAKQLGDILIVAVNSDSSVKSIKGKNKPINKLKDRMKIISGLESINYVCSFSQSTPLNLIKKFSPDILVKGGDWKDKEIVGADFVKSYGGKVVTIPFKKGYSTTRLIKKIISAQKTK
ncbi:MAG: D-glycero-beta-D-manno-heptose 1-phosphate adenylyltransferase [Candidatus Omnitrophica bacterium]|nr:D-glycero-beta-D-manno-heptose 1-phosphate adenylyltransferase [Candidatus Omnitrophota bacterium]